MKLLWLVPLLLLGGGLLLTACGKNGAPPSPDSPEKGADCDPPTAIVPTDSGEADEPPLPPGSLEDNTVWNAPKVIASTQIVTFRCTFSTVDMVLLESDSALADSLCTLTAEWKDGAVTGSYSLRSGVTGDGSLRSFQAGREFLEELQELAAKHDLPQYNGISRYTYGLPEDYGAELSITYASGETVCAGDNQDCFLSPEAIEDLERLFRQQAEQGAASSSP